MNINGIFIRVVIHKPSLLLKNAMTSAGVDSEKILRSSYSSGGVEIVYSKNSSSSLIQANYKIILIPRFSSLLRPVILQHKQMETLVEKKVSKRMQLSNRIQRNNSLLLPQMVMDNQDKFQKVCKIELRVLRPILNQSIKNFRRMNQIGSKPGIFSSIK